MDVLIGTAAADHVAISVCSAVDPSSEGWLISNVTIAVGAWRGSYEAWFCTWDFPKFREQLETLHSTLDGTARFDTLEHQLELEFTVDSRGHIEICGAASDRAVDGNGLTFSFELDQSYLPAIIKQLRAVEATCPHNGPDV